MAHNCMMFSIASGMESRQKALFEAKVRALAGVEGVYVTDSGHGRVWYNTNLLLPLLTKVLAFYRTQPVATPATRKEIVKTDSTGFNAYRRNALISGLGLIGWQVFKKVSPGAFAGAYGLRSAFVLFAARDFISNGVLGMLKQRQANADSLTTTAVIASIVGRKPESSLTLLLLANLAEMLTTYTAERTRNHISSMLRLDQQYAWKVEDEYEQRVAVENLCPGDAIGVHLGEKICVDGQVIEGSASVDQSPITGEYIPVEKNREDYVYAGTVVKNGYLKIRVEKVGDATALARIVHMVEEAQSRRAPVQNFADKMANMLVPISFIAAGLVYGMTKDWQRVLNMLFIDYSCGLKLSTATAISAAIGRAARQGILVKGGNYVETLANIDTIVLDKTGTITVGKPQVVQVETMFGIEEKEIVVMAASAEYHSSHPLASAILEYAIEKGWKVPPHSSTETIVARGILAVVPDFEEVEGGDIIVGSPQFMEENKIACQGFIERGQIHGECGHSVVYVARNRKLLGIMVINDPVRPNLKKTINRLRRQGIDEVIMITGDNEKVARYVAAELDIDRYYSEVLPADKATLIAKLQNGGAQVMMIGDGINDAPALAFADVGVAMGGRRTDVAVESADITINSDNPIMVSEVINIGRRTMKIIQQNFTATIAINTAAMLLGAMGRTSPMVSAFIHNAATIGVVLNSVRIITWGNKNAKPRI